ncbi:MAG: carboxymuconolactone decarboxylase family protein [Deltaproteobacteria bacterium]|nr:carboxymuconolactone decarboxylase family protein [Deltaproteobacteria bacterium]MBW2360012.1 carboxymuconolactone decarboxylase family protein [Deltaproteobacteria bacterium]
MSRLPLVKPETAAPPVRELFEAMPVKLSIFGLMAQAETCLQPLVDLGTAILSQQKLDPRVRELAILQAAQLTPGRYEWVQHVPIAEAVGASAAEIAAVERGDWSAAEFDAMTSAALRFGADTLQHAKVSDELFAELRSHFSPREIVELVLTLGYYSMLARLTEVTELEVDEPVGMQIVDALD